MSLAVVGLLVAATPSVATPSEPAPSESEPSEPAPSESEPSESGAQESVDGVAPADRPPERVEVDDPLVGFQWYLDTIRAPEAWVRTMGGPDITIAVIDTGVDPDHRDLLGALWVDPLTGAAGYDHVNSSLQTYRGAVPDWHGTAIAGIAAARADDGYGIAGVAPGVSVMVHRIYGSSSSTLPPRETTYELAADALVEAVAAGADVILLTWGGTEPSAPLFSAIRGAGVPVVAAAGNDGQDLSNEPELQRFPAMYRLPNLVTVAASDQRGDLLDNDRLASNHGVRHVDLAAPGSDIVSLIAGGGHGYVEGTSFAAPQVAAALALGRSFAPAVPTNDLVATLVRTVRPSAPLTDRVTSGGVLDVAAFLAALEQPVCGLVSSDPPFYDVLADDLHATSITCIVERGLTVGVGDGSFAPQRTITRGEMATFIVRMLGSAGVDLPAEVPTAFEDTSGSVHARSIDLLADAGIVAGVGDGRYAPDRAVTRGQMATLLSATIGTLAELPEPFSRNWFDDIDTSVHRTSILRARESGITFGTSEPRRFEPDRTLTREQMASFLARSLDALGRLGVTIDPVA